MSDAQRVPGQTDQALLQLRLFKTISVLLAILLLVGIGYFFLVFHASEPITILVNSHPIATVESRKVAHDLIEKTRNHLVGAFADKGDPVFSDNVQLRVADRGTPTDDVTVAEGKLASGVHMTVLADVIFINGKPFVGLPNRDAAQATLDAVRDHYANMPPAYDLAEKPSFLEKVAIERKRVDTRITQPDPNEAAPLLWQSPPTKSYTVVSRDTGWRIAHKFNIPLTTLLMANAGTDLNHLKIGDTINVGTAGPPLTVVVKKNTSLTETFGGTGSRQVTSVLTFINGAQDGPPTPMSMMIIHKATPRAQIN